MFPVVLHNYFQCCEFSFYPISGGIDVGRPFGVVVVALGVEPSADPLGMTVTSGVQVRSGHGVVQGGRCVRAEFGPAAVSGGGGCPNVGSHYSVSWRW